MNVVIPVFGCLEPWLDVAINLQRLLDFRLMNHIFLGLLSLNIVFLHSLVVRVSIVCLVVFEIIVLPYIILSELLEGFKEFFF